MPAAARLGDSITGIHGGEHSGHIAPHAPSIIWGNISGNCSGDVFVNGVPAAYVGSITTEHDVCCGTSYGKIAVGSSSVFINKIPAARINDALAPHSGSGHISSGSGDVFMGG